MEMLVSREYKFNDGMMAGNRKPRLYLARGPEVKKFVGKNIDGFCEVVKSPYFTDSKFRSTDYILSLFPGVRPIYLLSPLNGWWGDEFDSWGKVAEHLCLPVDVAKHIIRVEYPPTAARLDRLEELTIG